MSEGHAGATSPGSETLSGGVSLADYNDLFRNRDFRNLSLATVTSALGDWIGVLAILALTVEIMGPTRAAPFALGAVMAARVVPAMLLGPVAGVFVDRWNRKRVLIASDIGRGVIMALIPFTDELLTLLLATLMIEVLSALFAPAKDAVFPRLVRRDQLVGANQVNLVVTYGTLPLGGVLYAGLVSLAVAVAPADTFLSDRPVALPIWFNAISFLVSAPLLARLRVGPAIRSHPEQLEAPGAWTQLKEGIAFITSHPIIRALIVGVMIAFVAAGVVISLGELFVRILNAGPEAFGTLVAAVGGGLLIGLVASGPLTARFAKEQLFAPGVGTAGIALIASAMMPRFDLALVTGAVMGLGAGVAFIMGYTILQERTIDSLRGRTFAAFHTGVRVAILGATVAAPFLVGIFGIEQPIREPAAGPVGFYPYQIGGVRMTLALAGVLAIIGSFVVGRWLQRSLADSEALTIGDAPPVVRQRHGHLIAFEGGDGAGKSTQIRLLRGAIERAGYDTLITREPGGTRLGEAVRDLLLDPDDQDMSDRAEALLYAAARAQHVDEVIAPALEKGTVVLSDRYLDSSVVYQGVARGLGEEQISQLNHWATAGVRPDLVVLLDVDPAVGLGRLAGDADRLEAAGLEFHRTVNSAFRHLAALDPERYLVVDAAKPVEVLHARIRDAVLTLIGHTPGGGSESGREQDEDETELLPQADADDEAVTRELEHQPDPPETTDLEERP
jgi:dTMP kinase